MEDLIKRSDAIKAVEERSFAVRDSYTVKAILRNVPSADRPTVIRVKSIIKKEDYDNLEKRIKQQNPNVIVIPHNAELVTPVDRSQMSKATISYKDCAEVLLKLWCDNIITDGEYKRIMDRLNESEVERHEV